MLTYTVNLNAQFNNLYSNFVGYGLKIITPSDFGVIIGDNMQTQSALAFGTPYYNSFTKLQIFNTNYQLYNGTATIYILQSTSEEFPLASPVTIGTGSNPIQVTSITDPINVNQIASAITVSTITEPIDVNILTKSLTVGAITNPVDVNLITKSVTVGAITNPVNVNINSSTTTLPISGTVSINSGTVAVSSITNPVDVNLITKSVTVGAITNPVNVNINSSSATLPISGTVTANISNATVPISGTVNVSSGSINVNNIVNPVNVNLLTKSVTVSAITNPVDVNINSGTVAVSSITNPLDVNLITKSVTVGAITNPVNVNINSSSATLPISGTVNANITNATIPISGTVSISTGTINANITNANLNIGQIQSSPVSFTSNEYPIQYSGDILTGTYSIAVDSLNNIWLADHYGYILKVTNNSVVQSITNSNGNIYGIAVDHYDNIWITNNENNAVAAYTNAGTLIGTYTTAINSIGTYPFSLYIDSYNNIWVVCLNSIIILNSSGSIIASAGAYGPSSTSFTLNEWSRIKADKYGNIWITGGFGGSVLYKFSPITATTPYVSTGVGALNVNGVLYNVSAYTYNLSYPAGIAIDTSGNIWLANTHDTTTGNTLTVINQSGQLVNTYVLPTNAGVIDITFSEYNTIFVNAYSASAIYVLTYDYFTKQYTLSTTIPTSLTPYQGIIDNNNNYYAITTATNNNNTALVEVTFNYGKSFIEISRINYPVSIMPQTQVIGTIAPKQSLISTYYSLTSVTNASNFNPYVNLIPYNKYTVQVAIGPVYANDTISFYITTPKQNIYFYKLTIPSAITSYTYPEGTVNPSTDCRFIFKNIVYATSFGIIYTNNQSASETYAFEIDAIPDTNDITLYYQ